MCLLYLLALYRWAIRYRIVNFVGAKKEKNCHARVRLLSRYVLNHLSLLSFILRFDNRAVEIATRMTYVHIYHKSFLYRNLWRDKINSLFDDDPHLQRERKTGFSPSLYARKADV